MYANYEVSDKARRCETTELTTEFKWKLFNRSSHIEASDLV